MRRDKNSMKKINRFLKKVEAVSRDLTNWERQKQMTGKLPPLKNIRKEWELLEKLLLEAQRANIDKDALVYETSRRCVSTFCRLAPSVALPKVSAVE